jgi:hypothetical protein
MYGGDRGIPNPPNIRWTDKLNRLVNYFQFMGTWKQKLTFWRENKHLISPEGNIKVEQKKVPSKAQILREDYQKEQQRINAQNPNFEKENLEKKILDSVRSIFISLKGFFEDYYPLPRDKDGKEYDPFNKKVIHYYENYENYIPKSAFSERELKYFKHHKDLIRKYTEELKNPDGTIKVVKKKVNKKNEESDEDKVDEYEKKRMKEFSDKYKFVEEDAESEFDKIIREEKELKERYIILNKKIERIESVLSSLHEDKKHLSKKDKREKDRIDEDIYNLNEQLNPLTREHQSILLDLRKINKMLNE